MASGVQGATTRSSESTLWPRWSLYAPAQRAVKVPRRREMAKCLMVAKIGKMMLVCAEYPFRTVISTLLGGAFTPENRDICEKQNRPDHEKVHPHLGCPRTRRRDRLRPGPSRAPRRTRQTGRGEQHRQQDRRGREQRPERQEKGQERQEGWRRGEHSRCGRRESASGHINRFQARRSHFVRG